MVLKLKQNQNIHADGNQLENTQEEKCVVILKELVINQNAQFTPKDADILVLQLQEFTFQNVNGQKEEHSKEEEFVVHSQKDVKIINVLQEKFTANTQLESFIMDADGRESLNAQKQDVQLFQNVKTMLV